MGSADTLIYSWASVPEGFTSDTTVVTVAPQEPTWYFVTVSDNMGNSAVDSVFIDVYELPVVNIGADTSICSNITWTLDAGNPGDTYLWSTGEQTQTISIDTTGFGFGVKQYFVDVTNQNNCTNSDTIYIDFVDCTGIDEFADNVDVNIYPNPSTGIFNVDLQSTISSKINIMVISATGRVIKNSENILTQGSKSIKINLSDYPSGIYQLIIAGENGMINKKLIVK